MDLVGRQRRAAWIATAAGLDVVGIVPDEVIGAADDRGGVGAEFGTKGEGIAFQRHQLAVGADDLELVNGALGEFGNEDLPDAGVDALTHGVAAAVPGVEVADDRDTARIW